MTAITINLPESKLSQIEQVATHLNISASELLADIVLASFPQVSDVPDNMQLELLQMTWADTPSLWRIAESQVSRDKQERMMALLEYSDERELTPSEQDEVEDLSTQCGRVTLRKSHAYMLLSLRGGQPLPNN